MVQLFCNLTPYTEILNLTDLRYKLFVCDIHKHVLFCFVIYTMKFIKLHVYQTAMSCALKLINCIPSQQQ